MDKYIWEFTGWIYQQYGRLGCLVALLIIVAFLALVYWLLSRLPKPKEIIVWSRCSFCKYKCRKPTAFVLSCPQYEKPHWNQYWRMYRSAKVEAAITGHDRTGFTRE